MIQTTNYRIREASAYIDNSKSVFFPEVLVQEYIVKKRLFKKKEITIIDHWHCFVNGIFENTFTCSPKNINGLDNNIVSFSSLILAESWLRRYKEYREQKIELVRSKHYKLIALNLPETDSKIHEIK